MPTTSSGSTKQTVATPRSSASALSSSSPSGHDPGVDVARERSEQVTREGEPAVLPIHPSGAGEIRVGTASWTDPTMTVPGVFYPTGTDTAEERLGFYAGCFPVVEVDATYYALPSARTAELWVDRTPPDFTFDIKAHALMTGQPTETKRLPKVLREELPEDVRTKPRIYGKQLPAACSTSSGACFARGCSHFGRAGSWAPYSCSTPAGSSRLPRTVPRSWRHATASRASRWPSSSAMPPGSTRRTSTGHCVSCRTITCRS